MTNHRQLDRGFIGRNTASRERLRALVEGLSEQELLTPLSEGWTVATALAHLAFWDRRVEALLQHWRTHEVAPSPYDADVFNAAILHLSLALPPERTVRLVLQSAEAVDSEIETLSDARLTAIWALPEPPRLERALHRGEHIAEIERALEAV